VRSLVLIYFLRTYAKKGYNLDGIVRAKQERPYVRYILRKSCSY
jgi:hypothetical protein